LNSGFSQLELFSIWTIFTSGWRPLLRQVPDELHAL
jgi:hypothetical protein